MKKLACRLGRHEWTTRVEEGESYKVCSSCGKSPPGSGRSGPDLELRSVIAAGTENLEMGCVAIPGLEALPVPARN
jgi:hypothetical protein